MLDLASPEGMLDLAEDTLDWVSLDDKSIERLADVEDGLAEDALD